MGGKREIPTIEQISNEAQAMIDATNDESPLVCALLVAASIERALLALLGKHFACENSSALSSVYSCANLAYCLGFISKGILDNILRICRVRNRFAHTNTPIDFNTLGVADACKELTLPRVAQYVNIDRQGVVNEMEPTSIEKRYNDPRERFTFVGVCTFFELLARVESVEKKQIRLDHWDRLPAS